MKTSSSVSDVKALVSRTIGSGVTVGLLAVIVCASAAAQRRRDVIAVAYEMTYAALALALVSWGRRPGPVS